MLSVANFQQLAWRKLFSDEIYKIFEQASCVRQNVSIKYIPSNPDKLLNLSAFTGKMDATLEETLRVDIRLTDLNNDNSSQSTLTTAEFKSIPLVTLPILTEFGFVINGSKKGVVSKLRPASGWYFTEHKGRPALVLQAESQRKFAIYQSKPKKSQTPMTIIEHSTKEGGSQSLPLFEFLKAMSDFATYDDIIADLQFNRRALADYIASNDHEPNMEQCARSVLKCICRDNKAHSDPVKELHRRIYEDNSLMVGKERKPRFENFISYLKVVGYELAEEVMLDGISLPAGTIITTDIASRLDECGLDKVFIKLSNNSIPVTKCKCEEGISYNEIVTAVYHYYLLLDGIGSYDSQDNYCNKVLDSIAFNYAKYIRQALNTITSHIRSRLVEHTTLEDVIIADKLHDALQKSVNVRKIISDDETYQQFDETNSLSSFEQSFRISAGSEHAGAEQRDVQKSQYGRTDAHTTSESKKVGLNLSLSTLAGVDEYGFITTPVYAVKSGIADKSKIVNLTAIDERGKAIAPHDVDLQALIEANPEATVSCRLDGEVMIVPVKQIKYQYTAACQSLGPLMSMVPAANHDAGKRSTMAGNAQKQALPVIRRERPIVCTGTESVMDIGIIRGRDIISSVLAKQGIFDLEGVEESSITVVEVTPQANITMVAFTTDYARIDNIFEYEIPRINSTIKGSLRHYRLRPAEGGKYGADDIVFYANDVDIEQYQMSRDTVNFGGVVKSSASVAGHAVALGNNVRVLFKSLEGFGYEDAVIVNADFARNMGLAVSRVISRTVELMSDESNGIKTEQVFTRDIAELSDVEKAYLDINGLPVPGTRLKSGQVLVGRMRIETGPEGIPSSSNACVRLSVGESGTVINAQINERGNKARVTLGVIEMLEEGDKVSGYHGNKGVISRIMPAEDMPYTKEGVPDLVINPLGVPARQNLGQIIEAALGAYGVKTGEIQLLEPFNDEPMDQMLEKLKDAGITLTDVYDGRTGLKAPRQAMMGVMHFIRSEHVSLSKYNACASANDKLSPRTGQPVKASGGGQKYSELTSWCLESYGAATVIDTLASFQSDDIGGINKFVHAIKSGTAWDKCDIPYESHNADLIQAYMRTFGYNILKTGEESRVQILSDTQMRAIAHKQCNLRLGKDKEVLRDPSVFGESSNRADSFTSSRKWYGYLPTMFEFVQPAVASNASFLKMFFARRPSGTVDTLSYNVYKDLMDKKVYVKNIETLTGLPVLSDDTANVADIESRTGICGLMLILRNYNMETSVRQINRFLGAQEADLDFFDEVELVPENSEKAAMSGRVIDGVMIVADKAPNRKLLKTRNLIKQFLQHYDIDDIIVQGLLVPPIGYRPLVRKESSSAFDIQLGAVVLCLKMLTKLKPGTEEYAMRCNKTYAAIAAMIKNTKAGSAADRKHKTVFDEFTDHETKNSIVRDSVLSKRLRYSGRSVISVNSKLKINEVGIPVVMATKIFEDHLVAMIVHGPSGKYPTLETYSNGESRLLKRMMSFLSFQNYRGFAALLGTTSNIYSDFLACKSELVQMLNSLFSYYYALLNREPSLHKFSVTAFKAIPVWTNSIQLHPLACHGFNADFDGDQMSVVFPVHPRAQAELKECMMMSQNLINPKDGKLITSLNQDMVLGMYWATMFEDNRENVDIEASKYKSLASMSDRDLAFNGHRNLALEDVWDLIDAGSLKVQDIILAYTPDGRMYKSTAGRILFNSLLPDMQGFLDEKDGKFYKLRFDLPIKKAALEKVLKWATKYYESTSNTESSDSLAAFLDRLKDFGFEMADKSAISISIYDFAGVKAFDAISEKLEDVQKRVDAINEYSKSGFITESERKKLIINEWLSLRDSHVGNIMANLDRNSNLFMMIDSSARGDVHQLMEMCGIIGNIANAKGEMLETPILSNYFKGLSAQDLFASSYKARHAICAAQLSTANVGEMNRKLIYMVDHHHTRDSSMSCSATPTMIPLEYEITTQLSNSYRIATSNLDSIPEEFFSNGLTRERWVQFAEFIDNFARTTVCYAATKRLVCMAKLPRIIVTDALGELRAIDLEYKLVGSSRAMIWYRAYESEDLPAKYHKQGIKYRKHEGDPELDIVGDKVISLIEEDLLDEFPIYTIIGCQSTSGVCKRCFGLKYDTDMLPHGEEHVGYQAIQAIGEPTQQLVLDTHKRAGGKNKAASAGIQPILNRPMDIPDGVDVAALAPVSGVLKLSGSKLESLTATVGGKPVIYGSAISASNLLYIDGDYVEAGKPITMGTINYKRMAEVTNYRDVQVQFWKAYLRLYEGENIMARNFELLVLSQTEFGVACEDRNGLLAGETYPIRILQNSGASFVPTILPSRDAMTTRGKVYCSMFYSNTLDLMGRFAVTSTHNIGESNIGKEILGELRSRSSDKQIGVIKESRASSLQSAEADLIKPRSVLPQTRKRPVSKPVVAIPVEINSMTPDETVISVDTSTGEVLEQVLNTRPQLPSEEDMARDLLDGFDELDTSNSEKLEDKQEEDKPKDGQESKDLRTDAFSNI